MAGATGGGGSQRGVSDRGEGTVSDWNDALFNRIKTSPSGIQVFQRLIDEKMRGPQRAEDVRKMLLAARKPEEMKWTGLDDFLKGNKKITPEEIKKHLAENAIKVTEVTPETTKYGFYTLPGGMHYRELLLTMPESKPTNFWEWVKREGYTLKKYIGWK